VTYLHEFIDVDSSLLGIGLLLHSVGRFSYRSQANIRDSMSATVNGTNDYASMLGDKQTNKHVLMMHSNLPFPINVPHDGISG